MIKTDKTEPNKLAKTNIEIIKNEKTTAINDWAKVSSKKMGHSRNLTDTNLKLG